MKFTIQKISFDGSNNQKFQNYAEILISLCYEWDKITVKVIEAKNLPPMDPNGLAGKVENILKGILDFIPSPSPSVKIQIMGGKVCLRCKGKTLLYIVNQLLKTKSLLIVDITQ